jgi:hypothetical protein
MNDLTPFGHDDRVIQGTIIKLSKEGQHLDRDGVTAPDIDYIFLGMRPVVQRWKNGVPIEEYVVPPLPDVDARNAAIPMSEWEPGLDGQPRPPYQMQWAVYLLSPHDASRYTYINGTTGHRIAYERLEDRIKDMRFLRGENLVPIIRLHTAPMRIKKFNITVPRPEFHIADWKAFPSSNGAQRTALPGKSISELPASKIIQDDLPPWDDDLSDVVK